MADFETARGMLMPPLEVQLSDVNGAPVDLTTASAVLFRMASSESFGVVASGSMEVLVPTTDGKVRYNWQTADVAAVGYFYGQVIVTWQSGKTQAFPGDDDFITIEVNERLG